MPPRRGRGRGHPTQGPRRSSRGATRAAARPFPDSSFSHAGAIADGAPIWQPAGTSQQTPPSRARLSDALNALVRCEVTSSSGGAQYSIGAQLCPRIWWGPEHWPRWLHLFILQGPCLITFVVDYTPGRGRIVPRN